MTDDPILGQSRAAEIIRSFCRRAATVDAPVLLTGESGTGKGLIARAIHTASARARGRFIAVNCAGVPDSLFESEFFGHARGAFTGAQYAHKGLLEQADAGTIFLDEIGELPLALQAKLLTALEEGEFRRLGAERTVRVDARRIAATAIDLEAAVRDGEFRRDLYHRLVVLRFRVPPLREREDDILLLAGHYLSVFAQRYARPVRRIHEAAAERLRTHPWPGNVRQLAHAIEAAVLLCDGSTLTPAHLSDLLEPPLDAAAPSGRTRWSFHGSPEEERRAIQDALRLCRGNKTRAAELLGMARNTLRAKLG